MLFRDSRLPSPSDSRFCDDVVEVVFPMELNLRFGNSGFGGDKLCRCPFCACENDEMDMDFCKVFEVESNPPGGPTEDSRDGVDGRAISDAFFGACKVVDDPPDRAP